MQKRGARGPLFPWLDSDYRQALLALAVVCGKYDYHIPWAETAALISRDQFNLSGSGLRQGLLKLHVKQRKAGRTIPKLTMHWTDAKDPSMKTTAGASASASGGAAAPASSSNTDAPSKRKRNSSTSATRKRSKAAEMGDNDLPTDEGHADPSDEDEDSANEDIQEEASDDAASDEEDGDDEAEDEANVCESFEDDAPSLIVKLKVSLHAMSTSNAEEHSNIKIESPASEYMPLPQSVHASANFNTAPYSPSPRRQFPDLATIPEDPEPTTEDVTELGHDIDETTGLDMSDPVNRSYVALLEEQNTWNPHQLSYGEGENLVAPPLQVMHARAPPTQYSYIPGDGSERLDLNDYVNENFWDVANGAALVPQYNHTGYTLSPVNHAQQLGSNDDSNADEDLFNDVNGAAPVSQYNPPALNYQMPPSFLPNGNASGPLYGAVQSQPTYINGLNDEESYGPFNSALLVRDVNPGRGLTPDELLNGRFGASHAYLAYYNTPPSARQYQRPPNTPVLARRIPVQASQYNYGTSPAIVRSDQSFNGSLQNYMAADAPGADQYTTSFASTTNYDDDDELPHTSDSFFNRRQRTPPADTTNACSDTISVGTGGFEHCRTKLHQACSQSSRARSQSLGLTTASSSSSPPSSCIPDLFELDLPSRLPERRSFIEDPSGRGHAHAETEILLARNGQLDGLIADVMGSSEGTIESDEGTIDSDDTVIASEGTAATDIGSNEDAMGSPDSTHNN
jgi:hypothetical protein